MLPPTCDFNEFGVRVEKLGKTCQAMSEKKKPKGSKRKQFSATLAVAKSVDEYGLNIYGPHRRK